MCACVGRRSDDPKRNQSIQHWQLHRLGVHRDAGHRRRATKRQQDFVPPGIARLDVRPLIDFVLMHDWRMVIVSGEAVLMFRVIVPDVGVRVQSRHLA